MPTISNLDKYKNDLKKLIDLGNDLLNALQYECLPVEFERELKKEFKTKAEAKKFTDDLPSFKKKYQTWYSEAQAIIKLFLPDRLEDFCRYYQRPKTRKVVNFETYVIEDCLQGLNITRSYTEEKIVGPEASIPKFQQQIYLLKAVQSRFESSLFDIKQLVQADLFDTELEAAKELLKKHFNRAAGALAGVVLEKHLKQVCENHNLTTAKRHPTLSIYNEMLKEASIVDIPLWRSITYLADIRNLCDHASREPTADEISDLITQVGKLLKTLY